MSGINRSFAVLTNDKGSYVQVTGSCEYLTVEWHDENDKHFRAFQRLPAVPRINLQDFTVDSLRDEDFFRVEQVTEVFIAFFQGQPFPQYVHWHDVSDEQPTPFCFGPINVGYVLTNEAGARHRNPIWPRIERLVREIDSG